MNSLIKIILKKIKLFISKVAIRTFIQIVKFLINHSGVNIALTNDVGSKIDGIGAQLQRLLSIVALCDYIEIPFFREEFVDVSVHPLDSFQDSISKRNFINKVNFLFQYNANFVDLPKTLVTVEVPNLNIYNLFKITLFGIFRQKNILIKTVEPYAITNHYNDICVNVIKYFPNWNKYVENLENSVRSDVIYLHFRQGVGGLVVYPGQKISREMPLDYYFSKINQITLKSPNLQKIYIFTDAPQEDLKFSPKNNQKVHWEGTPGFVEGNLYVRGNDLRKSFQSKGLGVEVVSGGDPIEAIAIMSQASYLITSRSSLSYVAGLLNRSGSVYYPDNFWHPKPSTWY
jgi:hypothetical protein